MEKEWAKLELGMNVQLLTQSRKFPATGPQIHGDMLRLAIAYLLPMFYRTAHVVIGLPLDSIDTAKTDNSRKVQIIVQDMGQTVDQHGAGSFDTCMPPMV
ncbi:hypothetical protein GGI03_000520 [Coemansia sp. RSA 2337]|nr:hypothetical protein GGI03_000520 [Coemansia sp. RSA 2337]